MRALGYRYNVHKTFLWTDKWQAEEKEVDEEIRNGEINEPRSLEDFIDALKKL